MKIITTTSKMVLDIKEKQNIVYSSAEFKLSEIELKSDKKLRLEGSISTTKRDSNADIVSEKGQIGLVSQIKERIKKGTHITMDLDHESHERDKDNPLKSTGKILNKIPVALIDHVELIKEGNVTKTKVKATVNEDHPLYESIKRSIQNGYLHSFSIAYKVIDGFMDVVDGVKTRVLDDVIIRNIGITGVPVNDDAGFQVSLKSYIKKMEQEEQITKLTESVSELKSNLESKDTVISELKSQIKESATKVDGKIEALGVEELKSNLEKANESLKEVTELKSKVEKLETFLEELKSKGIHKAPAGNNAVEIKSEDMNLFAIMN